MTLNNLLLPVYLGWLGEERAKKQLVAITIRLRFSHPPLACTSDELQDTFCYQALTESLKSALNQKKFRLIEHLTTEIYLLTKNFLPQDTAVHIQLTKKPAITELVDGVSFSYGDFV